MCSDTRRIEIGIEDVQKEMKTWHVALAVDVDIDSDIPEIMVRYNSHHFRSKI
jgi:hypothetical protein